MEHNKLKTVGEMYFCSADRRPKCLKKSSLCCLHCDMTAKCLDINANSKIKPCNAKVVSLDDVCEFSL